MIMTRMLGKNTRSTSKWPTWPRHLIISIISIFAQLPRVGVMADSQQATGKLEDTYEMAGETYKKA